MKIVKCRSCGGDMYRGVTANGKSCPFDVSTNESHFKTCPQATKWSKKMNDQVYRVNIEILPEENGVCTWLIHLQRNLPGYTYAFDFQGSWEKCLEYIDGITPYDVIGSEEKAVTIFEIKATVAR